jgi:DNA repair protein RadD
MTTTTYVLRDYQEMCVYKCVKFLNEKKSKSGICLLPTGAGKSLIIANIIKKMPSQKILVLQPSKEILLQNYNKIISYGFSPTIYSASLNEKNSSGQVVLATIGSIAGKLFEEFKIIFIDECHLVNSQEGRYKEFLDSQDSKLLGFTATPYRLSTDGYGSMMKFLTRTREKIFQDLIYWVEGKELQEKGYLCKMNYLQKIPNGFNERLIEINSTGTDYKDVSYRNYLRGMGMWGMVADEIYKQIVLRKRKNCLVFTRFTDESDEVIKILKETGSGVKCAAIDSKMKAGRRDEIIKQFILGEIEVIVNVGVLAIGFDFPALETIIIARLTKSLPFYYQVLGRGWRVESNKKDCLIVDMVGNYEKFGKLEDLELRVEKPNSKLYCIWAGGFINKKLTNIYI